MTETRDVLVYEGTRYVLPAGLAEDFLTNRLPAVMDGSTTSFILEFDPDGEPQDVERVTIPIYPGVPLVFLKERVRVPRMVSF